MILFYSGSLTHREGGVIKNEPEMILADAHVMLSYYLIQSKGQKQHLRWPLLLSRRRGGMERKEAYFVMYAWQQNNSSFIDQLWDWGQSLFLVCRFMGAVWCHSTSPEAPFCVRLWQTDAPNPLVEVYFWDRADALNYFRGLTEERGIAL